MKKVYIEWYIGGLFLMFATYNHFIANKGDLLTLGFTTIATILIGVNSIKQFIAENKGETNE
jgi:hypothetical protein